jgi:glutamate dehydrogenase
MPNQAFPGTDEERAARKLIDAAATLLAARKAEIPKDFLPELFAHEDPEDLVAYDAHELATLAEAAFGLLSTRPPGAPKIRLASPDGDGHLKSISVLEIVNDDMPFLVDSVMGELTDRNLDIRLVAHPVFSVQRDSAGRLTAFKPAQAGARESFIHIHIERIDDERLRDEIVAALQRVLGEVRLAVQDWRAILARVREVIAEIKSNPPPLAPDDIAETVAFLEWLIANNFTFLGVRDYVLTDKDHALDPLFETGLGIMRSHEVRVLKRGGDLLEFTPEMLAFLQEPQPLIITKAAVRALVHRRVYMDYVGVKRFDSAGRLNGEFRIVGLFTSTVYTRSPRTIPYLRRKVADVLARAGFDPEGHSGKALANVLDTYPRSTRTRSMTLHSPSCSSTSAHACACWRGATASTASCPCSSMRRATATTVRCAARSATTSPRCSRVTSAPSIRSSRKGRWCACTSSSGARRARRRACRAQR